ncbi:MAG: hypothetical protein KUG81_10535 [Gammaproteobacteria bacterium]|nr:hypothetical protein [Gammaproteobacteria bacterium]
MKSPLKILLWCSLLALFALVGKANADAFGAGDAKQAAILSKQLAVMQEQLLKFKEQLSEIKATNEGIFELRDKINDVYDEYETVVDSTLEDDLRAIFDDYKTLTNLDDLQEADTYQEKYRLLHEEVGLRFKRKDKEGEEGGSKALEADMHKTLMELNRLEVQKLHYTKKLKDHRTQKATDKDYQRALAESQGETTLLLLEAKAAELERQQGKQNKLLSELAWDKQFTGYLVDPKSNKGPIEEGWLSRLLVNVLDPQLIYKGMSLLAGIPALFLWFFVLVAAIRLFQEAAGSITGQASIGQALRSLGGITTQYIIYTSSGFLIFFVMFGYFGLFDSGGAGEDYIRSTLVELKRQLINDKDKYDSWVTSWTTSGVVSGVKALGASVANGALNIMNVGSAGGTWVLYQAVSLLYVISTQAINMLFALLISFLWAFGFFAIVTGGLKGRFDLTGVWLTSIFGMFLWGVTEFILMALVASMTYFSSTWIVETYSTIGGDFTVITIWHLYCVVMMITMLVVKILAIWMSYQMAQNQSITGSAAGVASGLTMFMANKMIPGAGDRNSQNPSLMSGAAPEIGGERNRDKVATSMSNVMNAPVSDVGRAGMGGLRDLGGKLSDIFAPASGPSAGKVSGSSSGDNPDLPRANPEPTDGGK